MQKSKEDIQKEKDDFLRQFVVPEGNIWGWKFSMISLIGLLLVATFAAIGIATGNISLDEQVQKAKEAQKEKAEKEKARREEKADSLKQLTD
jgi:hypothetical protein